MPNQIRTSHLAKIRLTTHRISKSQHALGVNPTTIMSGVPNDFIILLAQDNPRNITSKKNQMRLNH